MQIFEVCKLRLCDVDTHFSWVFAVSRGFFFAFLLQEGVVGRKGNLGLKLSYRYLCSMFKRHSKLLVLSSRQGPLLNPGYYITGLLHPKYFLLRPPVRASVKVCKVSAFKSSLDYKQIISYNLRATPASKIYRNRWPLAIKDYTLDQVACYEFNKSRRRIRTNP